MRLVAAISGLLVLGAVPPGTARIRASVSGQVTILERAGEATEDLGNVVVYLVADGGAKDGRASASSLPRTNTVMALQSRQFSPRVRVVTRGSTVEFANQDPFSHNVFSKLNGGFDTGVYGRGKMRENVFREPGVYPLYCNVHPRMTAFVIALATPYFTQAGADGRFVFDSVPPGRYAMHVWHDRATEVVRDVVVPAAGARDLRVEMDARAYRYVQHKNKYGRVYTSATGDRY